MRGPCIAPFALGSSAAIASANGPPRSLGVRVGGPPFSAHAKKSVIPNACGLVTKSSAGGAKAELAPTARDSERAAVIRI